MKCLAIAGTLAMLLSASVSAQSTSDQFLDVFTVKYKPDKRSEFISVAKRIADANRKNHGSNWTAIEVEYGDGNTVHFVSSHKNMASIEAADEAFRKALTASFGANVESLFREMDDCMVSTRAEIRRRRWDLSSNVPQDPDGLAKNTGAARWSRTQMIRVRPGHFSQFEELARIVSSANAKRNIRRPVLVAQSVEGQSGGVFYVSTLVPSLADFDSMGGSLKEALSAEDWEKYQKNTAEAVISTETYIGKFQPEWSNPPEAIVNVTKDFWMPKTGTVEAARAKKKKSEKANP